MRMDLTFYNFDLDIFYLHNVECVYVDYCFHWQPILRIDFMIKAFYSSICKHTKEMTTLSTVTFLFFIYNKLFYSNKTPAVMSVKMFYLFLYFKLHNIINLSLSLLACEVHPGMLIYWMGRKASPTLKFINNQSFMDSVEKWLDCIWLMIDGWTDGWMSSMGSNTIKGSRCFIEQELLPSLLSSVGWLHCMIYIGRICCWTIVIELS